MALSRSGSFAMTPECEDLGAPTTVTSVSDTWWSAEESKFTTSNGTVLPSVIKQMESSKEPRIERSDVSMDISKPEVHETGREKQVDKLVSMAKTVEEKTGKVVKEVTEMTTLRVSHDVRLDIAAYKVISNTVQDHRENVDVKEIMDLERLVSPETNGIHHETDSSPKSDSYSRRDELSTKTNDGERVIKFARACEINQESRAIPVDTSKEITLSLKEYTRHHEDSGIEMSPTKREENLEGQDFLEKARKSGEWLRLKVLEVQPELTKLGATVKEATEFSNAHDEVLLRLQSKQSPVEELLRQADQLISNQRPRAEVYAAMAETLGQAWRDVNELLERRKQILDSNVLFQCRAEECRERMRALEMACNDTLLPIEIDAVKNFLSKIHDLRKNMLEALMGALQEGKNLLDRLKEIANEGTLDSRPERIKLEADHAVLRVEKWLEELHDRRRLIEASFRSRKTQLEQCLALALLATDLRDLEEILNDRIAALSSSCDQLGDSASSAELLLFELRKLQAEAKEFQDRSIKITKSTERLVSSGHFAGEQATEQAYAILGAAADYVNDLDQYESSLNRAVAFFNSARSAITKLDQLEIQLVTTEHPPYSTQLARFHAQTVATIEDVTAKPLAEGYALLDITGRGAPGAEGVKRVVEELENRKIRLLERCTAHEEENLEITRVINRFLDEHDELRKWLMSIPEAFLQGHQDMGSDAPMAEDFCRLHRQLLNDLERRREEVESLEYEILPIRERIEDTQRLELESKVDELKNSWVKTKNLVAKRIELGSLYLQFHLVVEELTKEIDSIENDLKKHSDVLDENKVEELGKRWKDLQPLYVKLTATGKAFLDTAVKIDDPYLDVPRACICVQTLLEKFANRQLTVTESWENWRTTLEILRERRIDHEKKIEESTRTIEWVSKFSEQLYPVITSRSNETTSILQDLSSSKNRILPELNKAVNELDSRIKGINTLAQKGEVQIDELILRRLHEMHENLRTTARDYETLLESLISIFQNIEEVEYKIDQLKSQAERVTTLQKLFEVENAFRELDAMKWSVSDRLSQIDLKTQDTIVRIKQQEPPEAGAQDIEKLKRALDSLKTNFEVYWSQITTKVEEYRRTCTYAEDLERIDSDLRDLNEHLKNVDTKIGENLQTAKATSASFLQFEKTVQILEERIETFLKMTEESISILTPQIVNDISSLRERWRNLKRRIEETKKRTTLSIEYFTLLEEAREWNREGSKLLVVIARKATTVKAPTDATELLREIENYLKPGEEIQERKIEKLKELSTIVFGTERLPQFNEVIVENRQMLDSFAVVSSELRTLAQNLKNAEDLQEKLRIEKQEADMKLQAARLEMAAAEAARKEAENAKKVAEKLAAETLEKAALEARRLKEESEAQKISVPPSFSVSAQTEKIESTDVSSETVVQETVTSAITTKEIHILQKTEIEETVPVRETIPPKTIVTEEIREEFGKMKEDISTLAPEFTVPLNDATVQEGEKFSFQCHLVGQPAPEIVWYKDGISILNNPDYLTTYIEGACTLTIEETFTEDSARYTCRAFNIAGSAETSATLTVKETAPEEQPSPPVFVKELVASVATEGSLHRMECIVEGNPLPTVQWFKNDVNIDNSPDYVITYNNGEAVLKFEEVFPVDKAIYTCKATNRLGQATTSASLDVQPAELSSEKPYFVTPLSNAMGRAGQRVKLECEAKGNPMPTLTWFHDGKPVEETMNVKIQTDGGRGSLIISEAFPKDAGCYTVVAKNELDEASVSCNVSVKGRLPHETSDSELACSDMEPVVPKIQMPLKDLKVQEGRSVRLDCIIVGQPEPEMQVIWYHDDQPVKESADFQLLFQGDKCSLVIYEAFLDDAGVYKVVAINSGGEASSQCTLTVTPVTVTEKLDKVGDLLTTGSPPKFVKLPTDFLVAEGETATFECAVTGEPVPELKWFSDSIEIVENERILIRRKEDGTSILRISSAIPEDKGNYVVKASNVHGEAKAFARLVVRSLGDYRRKDEFVQMEEKLIAPTFKEKFADRRVPEGVSTKFECIATGKPAPKVQWLFNDRPVHGKDFLVSVSGDRLVLTIPETESTHAGIISCVAENAAGKAICSARLEIGDWPGEKRVEEITERVLDLVEVSPVVEMHAASSSDKHFTSEKSEGDGETKTMTKLSEIITESSTTHKTTKKEYMSSAMSSTSQTPGQEPSSVCVKTVIHSTEQASSQDGTPPVVQSYKVEEHEKIIQDQPGEIRQEKTVIVSQDEEGVKRDVKTAPVSKPTRKSTAPRFVSPITGMIVDQGTDIVLEGIIDGFPQPTISWSKNGQELKSKDGMKITYAHNHVRLELKNVNVKDAGRYTCSANNEAGSASSTADLVVKKTIFPPVFGRRLQAQVVKRGDRVNMEVEITGTPEPTVTWFKDDLPIKERPPQLRIKQQGNCYMLIIEKAEKEHAGKYMVRATNAGGEAQSIADFAVFEPTPETMMEVHKTVVYETAQDKKVIQETIYVADQSQKKIDTTKKILPPSPSPSKFVKGEFRESDYESDYDGRIPPLWKPRGYESDDQSFRPVKPHLASSGKPKEPRTPLIKELEKREDRVAAATPTKQKTVLLPGSPPEIAYAPPPQPQPQPTYYEARSGVPFHNAIGTETKKTVRMDESTENSRRIVTVEQTSRVIKFGDQKPSIDFSSFDAAQKQKTSFTVPTPKKFVQGQFRESDYESDVDTRIKPKWAPADSDTEEPRYRKVQPPTMKAPRSASAPVRQEHVVSPLEFDRGPPVIKRQTSMTQLRDERVRKMEKKEVDSRQEVLKPGSPPEFGFISRSDVKKAANHVASRHMSDMTSSFKTKTEKFVSDIQSDLKQGKPILKHPTDTRASDGDEPRTYREESRHSEHGTKHIDPDTGLIYFKYDFGYEFGIVLPGEGKKTVSSTSRSIHGQRRASDIEVPIVHEFTTRRENGFAKRSGGTTAASTRQSKPAGKFGGSKTVKWEPTSESEFSEAEDVRNARKRHSEGGTAMTPPSLVIPCSPSPSRWDHTTPSPLSLSPSLPSLSPRYSSATGPPSNVDSAGSPWPTTNGVTSSKEVIQPYLEVLPKKAPIFITPLRDIAVVSGQTARFECIVQAEPQPNILWSKDGRIIENSTSYEIHYRNGVCRLTVVRAFPEDAGTYACTATNSLGSTVTSATLQVPGNRRSIYAPIS
ncbi:muscle M-line assembly protein unc-89 isoform X5 [Ceratina calcarata]|uniref:Muscle M-line assembly protein unc-89 isoform X5 n=1 Tax=Ceratina calcarata TaxID=156304 RepID=A0AAJ7WFN6_9HYME|nr:muscle M-line assembly protein unc-89 isoform X5 [Ceratina calcarata]